MNIGLELRLTVALVVAITIHQSNLDTSVEKLTENGQALTTNEVTRQGEIFPGCQLLKHPDALSLSGTYLWQQARN